MPFLTSKHTLDFCLSYAERAWQEGFPSLVVLGGDQSVGPPRCVTHAWQLREAIEIGDSVEIGANSCVDRAALGMTVIGEGTKLDNMVHVAHNCRIGRHVVVAALLHAEGGHAQCLQRGGAMLGTAGLAVSTPT